eukprot:scaffold103624_cov56-Attheya_sp.AAC.2
MTGMHWNRYVLVTLLVGRLFQSVGASFQPTNITVVQTVQRNFGPMMFPEGSPWCDGNPAYWWSGHWYPEVPYCEISPGVWKPSKLARLDIQDYLNVVDGKKNIDRHACGSMDVNGDGIMDVMCAVGANKGTGDGFTEVYLTSSRGVLYKVFNHGLDKYPSMRSRDMITLKGADNSDLVLITTNGRKRIDERPNTHRMFKRTAQQSDGSFFTEVTGPWELYFEASCVVVADFDDNGTDDILFCNQRGGAMMFTQDTDGSWTNAVLATSNRAKRNTKHWRKTRVEDVTNDGIPDLIVVGWRSPWYVRVFKGIPKPPFFDLRQPYFERIMEYPTPDVEVLDMNGDGFKDIYVIQTDEENENGYCGEDFKKQKRNFPEWLSSPDFVPPLDNANDLLLIGTPNFKTPLEIPMDHSEPGCGFMVTKFGDRTLALAQGTRQRLGHNLLLHWSEPANITSALSGVPSTSPSTTPSSHPISSPSDSPTRMPSSFPTDTYKPSSDPSGTPSRLPMIDSSEEPSGDYLGPT